MAKPEGLILWPFIHTPLVNPATDQVHGLEHRATRDMACGLLLYCKLSATETENV